MSLIEYNYEKRLAGLGGLDVTEVLQNEVEELYRSLLPSEGADHSDDSLIDPLLYRKYLGRDITIKINSKGWKDQKDGRDKLVRQQYFLQQAEGLLDLPYAAASYGINLPSYLKALEVERSTLQTEMEGYTSLLVGAETPETVIEFATTTKSVFPNANCTVLDYQDLQPFKFPMDYARFWQRALQMGREGELPSFNSVQTNRLMPSYMTLHSFPWTQESELFKNAQGFLKPGGALIMIEPIYNDSHKDHRTGWLQKAGFMDIHIEPALTLRGRRELDRWLKEKNDLVNCCNIDPYNNFLITATESS